MTTEPHRPNIVMILTDDHASQAISAYGSTMNSTPHIDEIAAEGVLLENCFATNALCSPSRASLLTGTYSHVNGVYTLVTPLDASQPTFISQLRAAGYRTAVVGKWHMGDGPGHDPEGFDYWDVIIEQGDYWHPEFLSDDGLRRVDGYATDVITDLALEWLERVHGEGPWCILIWHKAPHRPWEPHPRHADMFTDPIPVPETFYDDYGNRSSSVRRALMRLTDNLNVDDLKQSPPEGLDYEQLSAWKYQRYMEDYLRCVQAIDENVGRVTGWLRSKEIYDDTLVVYASDQGFFLGEHGWFDKRLMFEESVRMPFILSYGRKLPRGAVNSDIITNVDFARFVLEAAGVEPHEQMQGESYWSRLLGQSAEPAREGFYYRYWEHDDAFHHAPAHYGYRTDRYKLIYYYNDGLGIPGTGSYVYPPEWELYDLTADPLERVNVFDDPTYAEVRRELQLAMRQAQLSVGDEPHASEETSTNSGVDAPAH